MANHKSSVKRARQTIVINKRNREYLSAVKTKVKSFYQAIAEQKPIEEIENVYKMVQSSLAKAGQKGRVHKNNASRKIGRLAITLAKFKLSAGTVPSAAPTKKKVSTKSSPPKKAAKKVTASKTVKKKTASASKVSKKKK